MFKPFFCSLCVVLFFSASSLAAVVIDFDSDTNGDGDLATRNISTGGTGSGTGAAGRSFSETSPWSTNASYTGPVLYGGVLGEVRDTVDPVNGDVSLSYGDYKLDNGVFNIRWQKNISNTDEGRIFMAGYFETPGPVMFDATSSFEMSGDDGGSLPRFESISDTRWLVRDVNGIYYVSNTQIANSTDGRTLDGAELLAESWSAYDPNTSLDWNDANPFSTTTLDLNATGIDAVGWIVDKDGFSSARSWLQFTEFQVDAIDFVAATNVPEPSSIAAWALLAIGIGFCRRNRKG